MRKSLAALILSSALATLPAQAAGNPQESTTAYFLLGMNIAGTADHRVQILLKWADIIRKRLVRNGVRDAIVLPKGEDRILLRLPEQQSTDRLNGLLASPDFSIRLVDSSSDVERALTGDVPPADELLWLADETGVDKFPYLVAREISIPGKAVTIANAGFDGVVGNKPVVTLEFNVEGTSKLAELTSAHINKTLVLALDGKVIAATVIREPIFDGRLTVFGGYIWDAAQTLALAINSSTTPPPFIVTDQ